MENSNQNYSNIKDNIAYFKRWMSWLKNDPKRTLSEEIENALDRRNHIEKDIKWIQNLEQLEGLKQELSEADEILREIYLNFEYFPESIEKLWFLTTENRRAEECWWWHPEQINPDIANYFYPEGK